MELLKRYTISIFRLLILAIPVAVIVWFVGNKFFTTKGYDGTGDFLTSLWDEVVHSYEYDEDIVDLYIDEKGMQFLSNRVDKTKARGIHTNKGADNYIGGSLVYKGDTADVEVRLKGHMMDHFQGDKWSFRIKTKGDDRFRNMSRFTFQHPGTRAYINEWIYHQLASQNDLISLQYDFFRLKLNGEDRGIYAVEEHFAQELAKTNQKPEGVFVRWNPNLYWEGRLDEKDKLAITKNQYMDFSASYVDPYDEGTIEEDPVLLENFQKASWLLEQFRRGELTTSEVFDVKKLATLHALIDLVGGHHSLDWSDVKYFYNGITEKLEPVAYESFSIRPIKHLAGQRHLSFSHGRINDFHDRIFSDMQFYSAYVRELERLSQPKFLNTFFDSVDQKLQQKRAVLAKEFPYKHFEKKAYYKNQNKIRKLLATPLGFYAHFNAINNSVLTLDVANMHEFPFEVMKVKCNGRKQELQHFLPPKKRGLPIEYSRINVAFDEELKDKNDKNDIEITYRIPGSEIQRELKVTLIPAYTKFDAVPIEQKIPSFLYLGDDSVIYNKPGEWTLNKPIRLPSEYALNITSPFELNFEDQGALIISSDAAISGSDDNPVRFTGNENNQSFLSFENGSIESTHVVIDNLNGNPGIQKGKNAVNLIGCSSRFSKCDFLQKNEKQKAVYLFKGNSKLSAVYFEGFEQTLEARFADLSISKAVFKNCDQGMHLVSSVLNANNVDFIDVKHPVYGEFSSSGRLSNTLINEAKHGIEVQSNSFFTVKNIEGKVVENLLKAENHNPHKGKTGIQATQVKCDGCENIKKTTHGTQVEVD